ncbi:laminin subunit gamma-3 isoform X2 [Protopterus annectens]|nr:laminin subunit gamma-3 isoform X2 [Protopterus annectens]
MDSCYNSLGRAQRCMPTFENAAFNRSVKVTNVCGLPQEIFCPQTAVMRMTDQCHRCDAKDPILHHNATYLTDFHSDEEPTWWQSQSMAYGVQYPTSVNLTLHLGKSYEITYVRLMYYTSRPESFAIYKRMHVNGPWIPYQYYSASCHKTYGKEKVGYLRQGDNEQVAFCTDEFSDISPLTGGNVAFSTLEGRPSAYNFDESLFLQEWVTATDIMISLTRLNTFGDDIFKDPKVLSSYFYAISDFSVGGRCKCNGHASECVYNEKEQLVCKCQHNTSGTDCDKCLTFYHDRPWARATAEYAYECLPCNCSGRAENCFFDAELYRSTGHGGHCINCRDNTAGPHCEQCQQHFYQSDPQDICYPCNCNSTGSLTLQCNNLGMCSCKQHVTGEKCDQCQLGYHSLTEGGCRPCECNTAGSTGICNPDNGRCPCKENVEGYTCDMCKPGTFNLQPYNPSGCTNCFCYGHSSACRAAVNYTAYEIESNFTHGTDGWREQYKNGSEYHPVWTTGQISLQDDSEGWSYFIAPDKFLGNQLFSYGQLLSLSFQIDVENLFTIPFQLILEGPGLSLSASLPLSFQDIPVYHEQNFTFRLYESEAGIQTSVPSFEFHRMLSNLSALKIGIPTSPHYTIYLKKVILDSARLGHLSPAVWVEDCICPEGYIGQFCEHCAPGYKKNVPCSGTFAQCIPCTCNQHGTCDPETGVCFCLHNTVGPSCERCQEGFFGNPFIGQIDDCKPCPCPGQTACAVIPSSDEVVCTNCPQGHAGRKCELCDNGFYGDPLGLHGEARPCVACHCNGNVELNAIQICHHLSGQCQGCLYNTTGDQCERCREGFYGNALTQNSIKCISCDCSPYGVVKGQNACDPFTGQCVCLPHVAGQHCSHCELGFFNLNPDVGCERCNCHPIGSQTNHCDPVTGQCICLPGVQGLSCDQCKTGFFSFSPKGCRNCNCSPLGSETLQCWENGTCICRRGFIGYKCDQCEVNHFFNAISSSCTECPLCYSLVLDEAKKLKEKLQKLEEFLKEPDCNTYSRAWYYPVQQEESSGEWSSEPYLMKDTKEFLITQTSGLERALQTVLETLENMRDSEDCSTQEGKKFCFLTSAVSSSLNKTQTKLQIVQTMLQKMVIPAEVTYTPKQWHIWVNESHILAESLEEMVSKIKATAEDAVKMSNITYMLLSNLLEDNSTEDFIDELEDKLLAFHSFKDALSNDVGHALQEANDTYASIQQFRYDSVEVLNVTNSSAKELLSADLYANTKELENVLQEKDSLLNEMVNQMQPSLDSVILELERKQIFDELAVWASESHTSAVSSVIAGKKTVNEVDLLLKDLTGLKKDLVQRKTHTNAAFKKIPMIGNKTIPDVVKKSQQVKNMIGDAMEKSALGNKTTNEAKAVTGETLKRSKTFLAVAENEEKRARDVKNNVNFISGEVNAIEQEYQDLKKEIMAFQEVTADMSTASNAVRSMKSSLKNDIAKLTKLLHKIENLQLDKTINDQLNESQAHLETLRHHLENKGLEGKLKNLQDAAEQQKEKMQEFEKEIEELVAEKISLEGILLDLPENCPEPSGGKRQHKIKHT